MYGNIIEIHIAAETGSVPRLQESVSVRAGEGIAGDRYCERNKTLPGISISNSKQAITFIESENIDDFNESQHCQLNYGEFRRNVITRGVRLNDLVGQEFYMGAIKFKGVELCEPCSYLAKSVDRSVLPHMVGRAGLRASILSSGQLQIGDCFKAGSQDGSRENN